jgi:hypothetical protein
MSRINVKFRLKLVLCWLFTAYCAQTIAQPSQQLRATLSTTDTVVELSAGPSTPAIISLGGHHQNPWRNRSQNSLPAFVQLAGARLPLTWRLVPHSATVNAKQVTFVYESKEPHLRLSWQWTTRTTFGPIEHRIELQNLETREFWMPITDSLSLDWQISSAIPLHHFYVDKGAGEPTPIGTHLDHAGPGYRWTGWSTTYAHDVPGRGREIIPYEAVFLASANHPGWYAGIEFSGPHIRRHHRIANSFSGRLCIWARRRRKSVTPLGPRGVWFATHLGEPPLSAYRKQQLGRRHADK